MLWLAAGLAGAALVAAGDIARLQGGHQRVAEAAAEVCENADDGRPAGCDALAREGIAQRERLEQSAARVWAVGAGLAIWTLMCLWIREAVRRAEQEAQAKADGGPEEGGDGGAAPEGGAAGAEHGKE